MTDIADLAHEFKFTEYNMRNASHDVRTEESGHPRKGRHRFFAVDAAVKGLITCWCEPASTSYEDDGSSSRSRKAAFWSRPWRE